MAKIAINIATGSLQKEEVIVGIDLGTSNSLVAIIHPETGKPVALKEHDKDGKPSSSLVPSVIHFLDSGEVIVGEEAKKYLVSKPLQTIFSAKRLMGKSFSDVKEHEDQYSYKIINDNKEALVKVQVADKFYSPVDFGALILKELKSRAEHILKTPVNKAVITVPAYFNDAQRQGTRDAGKLAGLDVLRIINEPTAASLAYGIGLHKNENKVIAVYDLGGGTFDISILRITDGVFEVLSTHGDTYLGGDDMDMAIVRYWQAQLQISNEQLHSNKNLAQTLRLQAEEAKKTISTQQSFNTRIEIGELTLSREIFNELIKPLVTKTIECCSKALKDAQLSKDEIESVVLVGGSTRVALVKQMVSEFFGKPVNDSVHPDEVVALGAAIQADILAGNNREVLLLDITPLSLGIETSGGLMDVLIPRNSKIPSGAARQYTTQIDGQANMRISVYQGERDLVKDNRKLAEFNLTGIPGMPAGLAKVEVKFIINADGILKVSAKELRSGVAQEIEIKPQYGITDEEVEKMLMDSVTHAKEDIALRALTEAKTEGEQLLKTTERFLQKNAGQLLPEELTNTAIAMQALQLSITMNDKDLVHKKMEELNTVSRPYAERIMDNAIAKAMKGKTIG
ncbi:MAG: heat-shock protein Hsp70 [Niastella sp. SCN 39-18]|nr:Fe-S protein assembly chaperone HscA [Sphingobacteriales bacterium]ODT50711.1 MAG: heat-shock protein Hsp70 [Niastella sp. SCN 39-18]OJW07485.1 MAG: heat-shock protein Hsp70 [Sphingobacteriales bacterium 39-19]